LQAKLLRSIQEKEISSGGEHETDSINVRILAATNRDWSRRFRRALSGVTFISG